MKFNKNEFGWKEKVSVNTNLNNDILNIKFSPGNVIVFIFTSILL